MFNNVSWSYDSSKKIYSFSGLANPRLKHTIAKVGYSIDKQKHLFDYIGVSGIKVSRFFLPDVYYIFKTILESGSSYNSGMRFVKSVVDIIEEQIIPGYVSSHKLDMDRINTMFIHKPLSSQKDIYESYIKVRSINGSRGMLLDAAIGSGKTFMSLSLAEALHSENVLIVAPLGTINKVWVESIAGDKGLLFRNKQRYYVIGSSEEYSGEKYVICSYENIQYLVEHRSKFNINYSTLIVDEVHNFNTITSKRTKQLMYVLDHIKFEHTIPMSGTPIKTSGRDMLPILKIINSDFDKKIMNRFMKVYKGRSKLMEAVLKERYSDYTVVVRKTDVELPPVSTKITKIKLKNSAKHTLSHISKRLKDFVNKRTTELEDNYDSYAQTYKILYSRVKAKLIDEGILEQKDFNNYEEAITVILNAYSKNNLVNIPDDIKYANKFEKEYIEPYLDGLDKKRFREAKTVYKYISLKVQGEGLANVVMRARIDCYKELAAAHKGVAPYAESTIKKTLVFSQYVEVCDVVNAVAESNKYKPVTVYGPTSQHLTKNVNLFINNDNLNPLISTYKSLSTGVPLIVANVIVIYGLPFRQYVLDQTIGRAWRVGQDLPVTAYIVELDTGDEPNITDRDFDIIDYYRKEVASFTGSDDALIIDRSDPSVNLELSGLVSHSDNYLHNMIKSTNDVIKTWLR